MQQRAGNLMEEVRGMLINSNDLLEELNLVDTLQRLGLAYHFEKEIHEKLAHIYGVQVEGKDLHVVALRFRLLRQEGYNVPSDEFNRFKDLEGGFRATDLNDDYKGLLNLYEAAYLSTPGEVILDEAITFCRSHLMSTLNHLESPDDAALVAHALDTPLPRTMKRLEARHYISIYEGLKVRNDSILELAKLDFNLLQLLHQEEIKNISMWWKKLGLIAKLTFARDRVVECYFWMLGVYFEPHQSRARIMATKMMALASILDDIYDAYGTLEELQLFTDVIQRWDIAAISELPEYMKMYFLALVNTLESFEDELRKEEKSYRVDYLKGEIKSITRAYIEEAKWCNEKYVPTIEDHLRVSLVSVGYLLLTCASYIGMDDIATKEAFDWVPSFPKIIKASSTIARLKDDIKSCEFEQMRPHVASTVQCYMNKYHISMEETCKKLQEMVGYSWKVINQECLQPTDVPKSLLMSPVNLACMIEIYYKEDDGYTNSSGATKEYITSLLVQPIPI